MSAPIDPRVDRMYEHQKAGVDFLCSRPDGKAFLADTMGLGKTIQASMAASLMFDEWPVANPPHVVIVCPASVRTNWAREWEEWGPRRKVAVEIISYASKRLRDLAARGKPDLVILDEAHYCKSPSAKRTRAALTLAARASFAWLLSGTPMPNHPGELYTYFKYLWPEALKPHKAETYQRFMRKFCKLRQTPWGDKPIGVRRADELYAMLRPIMLRRTLEGAGIQMPPLRVTRQWLSKQDVSMAALEDCDLTWEEIDAQEYTSSVRRLLGVMKAPAIAKVVNEELEDGQYEKIVVLAHHHETLDILHDALDHGITGFRGGATDTQRQAAIDDFTNNDDCRIFLGQMTAAGTGINLQAATEIILVEPDWSPDQNRQAIKRIHRIGQDSPCRARIFTVSGTLDENVMEAIYRKDQMQEEVGVKGDLT